MVLESAGWNFGAKQNPEVKKSIMEKMQGAVLVTGAGGSLGQAVVRKFASNYNVIATVQPEKSLGYQAPANVYVYEVDLSDEDRVEEFIKELFDRFGSIQTAIFLAGGYAFGGLEATRQMELHRMIRVNFETAYYSARSVFLRMIKQERGGKLVFIAARPALKPETGTKAIAYSLSKSLLVHFAALLNAEAGNKDVMAMIIAPSVIDTPTNRASMPSADFSKWVSTDEIARIIGFITSTDAGSLSDPVLKVYGKS